MQSQVRFNRVLEKVPKKVPGSLGAKPSQAQQGSGEGSREGEGRGDFGAEPGQVQQGSGEGSGEGSGTLGGRAKSGSTGFRKRLR